MGYSETRRTLFALAAEQGGYFTARQAREIGYGYPHQNYHVARGSWERVTRGIYRLSGYPEPERSDLIVLSLMSQNNDGIPQAIVSHEAALAVYELSDVNPARIHLTVPPGFRQKMPTEVILHKAVVSTGDWEQHEGYRITAPLRTLLDIAGDPVSWIYLDDAIHDALQRGIVSRQELLAAPATEEVSLRLSQAITAAQRAERKALH